MDVLQKIREEIDQIDQQVMNLLDKRMELAVRVIEAKNDTKKDVYDPTREYEIYQKCDLYSNNDSLKAIYREIMQQSKNIQKSRRSE